MNACRLIFLTSLTFLFLFISDAPLNAATNSSEDKTLNTWEGYTSKKITPFQIIAEWSYYPSQGIILDRNVYGLRIGHSKNDKKLIETRVVGLDIGIGCAANKGTIGIQTSFLCNKTLGRSAAIQLSGFYNYSRNFTGYQLALANTAFRNPDATFTGLVLQTGLINLSNNENYIFQLGGGAFAEKSTAVVQIGLVGKAETKYSLQINLLANISENQEHAPLKGLQIGGLIINRASKLTGVQIGALINKAPYYAHGMQIGIINQIYDIKGKSYSAKDYLHGTLHGLQIGVFNYAGEVKGMQIGLINSAVTLKGLQLGLINLHYDSAISFLPFINIGL